MDVDLPKRLQSWGSRLRGVRDNKILVTLILILLMGLFFYFFSEKSVSAQESLQKLEITAEIIDPLSRVGKGIVFEKECPEEMPVLAKIAKDKFDAEKNPLEKSVLNLVSGYPIERMAKAISKQEKIVAAFLVAIAKKESAWGKHVPTNNGKDCFNYWGYRGKENPTESGYSCFETPEEAVAVVGARIQKLVDQGINTPEKMLVWKCGSSCATHDPAGVRKWVSDVAHYIDKI